MSKKFFDYGKSFSRMGMAVVAALALTAGFASCGDDDDEGGSAHPIPSQAFWRPLQVRK